jgi:hypothetical protein
MAVEDAIAALREHWDDVISQLDPQAAGQLGRLVGELSGPGREAAADQIADILVDSLPARHPVRRALVSGVMSSPLVLDWDSVAADLLARAGLSVPGEPEFADDSAPSVAEILRRVTERLLAAPALSEQQVLGHGADPADPGLIRLPRPDGGQQWPLFQFTPGNGPLRVVRAINILLDADGDPLGAADWWLSRNGWLDGRPSELLGRVPDDVLLSAARVVGSEV